MMAWTPTATDFLRLLQPQDGAGDVAQPYPFFLASPLQGSPSDLGSPADWLVEWKWDGLRAQIIRRQGQALIWSRGEEMVSQTFPEITEAARTLDNGTVLDGEILAWRDEKPLPFGVLQRRIGRKEVSASVRASAPVIFLAFDLLEFGGKDFRSVALQERRATLQKILGAVPAALPLRLSPLVQTGSWEEMTRLHTESRTRGVEGLMFKRRISTYQTGRVRGDWWKWKIDPYVIDTVLIYAEQGHGRRASLFTDYTFGVWHEGELVPVAKAYSGLDAGEIAEVDSFVRRNTIGKFGPVRVVKPELVFELAFEGLRESSRHRAGIALRFPRMNRWRKDKKPEEADRLETLRELLKSPTKCAPDSQSFL
jgi:DNA ligase-1